jgi:predicted NBD/HSP70 family sugar kinase
MKQEENVWKNQSNLRILNQFKVVEALRKKPQSCADMASALGLSNVSIKRITDELYEENLIMTYAPKSSKSFRRGRKPFFFTINTDVGVVAAIDLSGRDLRIAVADLTNTILVEDTIPDVIYIDVKVLERVADALKALLARPEVSNYPLLGICVSTPGEFDETTFDFVYAPRILDCQHINLKTFFRSRFDVDVSVCHDMNLGMVGETKFGAIPPEFKNVYLCSIDYLAGSSLLLNGTVYRGTHGFAGEITSLNPLDEHAAQCFSGQFFTIGHIFDEIKKAAKDHPEDPFYAADKLHLRDVVRRYEDRDPVVKAAIDKSARYNAIQMLSVANLLDLDAICIQGRILEFGPHYLELVKRYFRGYDANRNTTEILASPLGDRANLLGAVYQAGIVFFMNRFLSMARKRNSEQNDVYISKFIGNII